MNPHITRCFKIPSPDEVRKNPSMRTVLIALGLLAAAEAFAPVSLAGAPKVCLMICRLLGRFWMSVLLKQLFRSSCGPRQS